MEQTTEKKSSSILSDFSASFHYFY
jgi:hypothetical protein